MTSRIRRVLRVLVAALSLALAVASALAWARSAGHYSFLEFRRGSLHAYVTTVPGQFAVTRVTLPADAPAAGGVRSMSHPYDVPYIDADGQPIVFFRPRPSWRWLGFGGASERFANDPTRAASIEAVAPGAAARYAIDSVTVPFWALIALGLIAPARAAIGAIAAWRSRAAVGRCHACGYDLRATPDRCPECGVAAAAR